MGPKCRHKGPCKRETGGLESEREDIIMEAEVREERDRKRLRSWLRRERGRGHGPKDAGPLGAGKGTEGNGRSATLMTLLILAQQH